jgi:S-DNA-T family DNA segregation ATPase FtsK/SpoIIIE
VNDSYGNLKVSPGAMVFLGAAVFTLLALIIGVSLSASLFEIPDIKSPVGDFFADSYGVLSFIIPGYLLFAASILLDKRFRPRMIFILNGIIFPFLTLAAGFSFLRDYASYSSHFAFFDTIGRNIFSFIVVSLMLIECVVIYALAVQFFPEEARRTKRELPPAPRVQSNGEVKIIKFPQPDSGPFAEQTSNPVEITNGRILPHFEITPAPVVRMQNVYFNAAKEAFPSGFNKSEYRLVKSIEQPDPPLRAEPAVIYTGSKFSMNEPEAQNGPGMAAPAAAGVVASVPAAAGFGTSAPAAQDDGIVASAPEAQAADAGATTQADVSNMATGGTAAQTEVSGASVQADPIVGMAAPEAGSEEKDICGEAFKSLDVLNKKLETLSCDMNVIDSQCDTLDSKIETLKSELEPETQSASAFEKEKIEADDLEDIINEAEAEAHRKTCEALAAEREALEKKKTAITAANYSVPVEGILEEARTDHYWLLDESTKLAARILTETLREFHIEAEVTGIKKGPVITSFEILPSPGVKLSKIVNLQDNIALRLAAASVRIVAPIPGKHAVGIEIPNKERSIVSFREIIEGELEKTKSGASKKLSIPIVLGKDITGNAVSADLATMPHLLIAGSTGSGKSVCVNTMILSILYQCPPSQCRLILIDPKIVELKLYNDIPHLLTPVITEPKRAFQALQYCICEMERRYACLDSVGVRDIKTYNKRIKERKIAQEHIPYIVVVIDEFADLMATTGKELESTVARLAAMSRAVGIHLVLATQRPSIDVITGLIKSNIPSRIAFMVASMMDSRIIIDTTGAEKLLGKGDMLYSGVVDPFPVRMQGAFVSEDEVERVVDYVRSLGEPDYIDEEIFFEEEGELMQDDLPPGSDPLFEKAMEVVLQQGKASASYIQRRLKIGYNRAARLVEEMESRGIVGPAQGSKPRELLHAV